ncbi:succinylglutamate desuccinylase/aspartoacylase family protein [Ectothiorhodospiraceae bacterium 2226]|nr:succinylglutamate desuccinylase/aspartoacylase family protein [Ectothiorhodospiraceae bacterium 2226]
MLTVLDALPDGLLTRDAARVWELLRGPTLIHLPGRREPPLFVSVLLHGNETTGWDAVRALLARYAGRALPRALSLFVGNVAAARAGVRRLPGQPDYNRVWTPGKDFAPERALMAEVVAAMAARGVFASVDVHNNTGRNPHYACVNRLMPAYLHLATLFSRTVVYFRKPDGVQSMAFAELCPAVTLECGQPGQAGSMAHALDYLEACLHLNELPSHPVAPQDIGLFHTVAVVKVPPHTRFGFGAQPTEDCSLCFAEDLDHYNFHELPQGTVLGYVNGCHVRLEAWDEQGADVGERYFTVEQGTLRTRLPVMPSMLTRDENIIRQDCLCYLMERLPLQETA